MNDITPSPTVINRNSADVQTHREKRKQRIATGDPKNWNIKDCATILGTDYLREEYGYQAWLRIQELQKYPSNFKKHK